MTRTTLRQTSASTTPSKPGRQTTATAALPVLHRPGDPLVSVYEADPDGHPVVHHRVVDTLGRMLKAGTITCGMHDAARDFQASFTIASYDPPVCPALDRLGGAGSRADLTDLQLDARRRVMLSLDVLGGLGSPAGDCVWHVVGLHCSIREWAMRKGCGGKPIGEKQAQGILIAALGVLAAYYGYGRETRFEPSTP